MTENKRFIMLPFEEGNLIFDELKHDFDNEWYDSRLCLKDNEIVDLLNEQHEQIEDLKDANVRCCNEYSYFHKRMMELEKENEKLKQFIKDLTTKGTGRIDLASGYSYNVGAVLTGYRGDVE